MRQVGQRLLSPLSILKRELVLKELRLFFRDTTQWSQLILLAVLVVVYVFNIKYLPLRGEGITFFLVNVIPFLNLVLAGFVLASIAARFIFPSVSLEGRTLWLLRSSPMPVRDLLWAKFWVGTTPLLLLALGIVGVTNTLLQVSDFMFAVSVMTITLMTFALCGMALGFGTLFPQFETENAAQIPTSFGGLVFMIAAIGLIAGVIILEARPVYSYLSSRFYGTPASPGRIRWWRLDLRRAGAGTARARRRARGLRPEARGPARHAALHRSARRLRGARLATLPGGGRHDPDQLRRRGVRRRAWTTTTGAAVREDLSAHRQRIAMARRARGAGSRLNAVRRAPAGAPELPWEKMQRKSQVIGGLFVLVTVLALVRKNSTHKDAAAPRARADAPAAAGSATAIET